MTGPQTRSLAVVTAGLRQPSSTRLLADRLTEATVDCLDQRGVAADVHVVEVRDYAHELMDHLLTGFPSPRLREVIDPVAAADGIIAVTPIFTASYSGLFKTFMDVLEEGSLAGTPVLLAATGGTARHSLALEHAVRPLFGYLRAVTVPTAVFAAAEDWGAAGVEGALHSSLGRRITRAATELAGFMARNEPKQADDPFVDVTPFEQLLRGED